MKNPAKNQAYRLLLVDDDPAMVRLLKAVVARHFKDRIELSETTDPQEALNWIDAHGPEMIVTDLEMPGAGGLDILRVARQRKSTTQVIVLTGHSSAAALLAASELGACDYLLKPVVVKELTSLLDQACDRVRRWREALHVTVTGKRELATAKG